MKMYDSINVDAIPADATELLAYTDGLYANVDKMRARFPNARIHTISAVGQVVGEWIDVEQGCVWPPNAAVDLWHAWRSKGCRGFYCSISLQPTIRGLLAPGDDPEWFDANYTGVDHVDPGDVATQYADPGPYDISETTPAFEGQPPAPTAPPPAPIQLGDTVQAIPFQCTLDAAGWTAIGVTLPAGKTKDNVVSVVMDAGSPYDGTWAFASASVDFQPDQPGTCRVVVKGDPGHFFTGRVVVA